MRWTSMELAAMATAAVPGLSPTGVAAAADDARDFTSAIVVDVEGGRWRVRSPQHQEAAMRLETELQVLRGFSTAIRAELPFRLPSVAGAVRRGELRTFVYNHLPGVSVELEELNRGSAELIDDVGATIAAIHDLDEAVVDNADLPRYSAERFRQRRLNELDQAATTGQIPATLLRRWEHAMEERELWTFTPTVTHGDLHEDSLLIDDERVVAVTGWTDLHIGDPADDFAWLTASPDVEFSDAVLAAYRSHRRGPSDPHLMRRAALSAEFALAQWLVRGHTTENQEMVDEARELLRQLEEDVVAHGGQPISLSSPDAEPTADAAQQDSQPVARPGAAATVADTGEWSESGDGDDEPAVITDASADESAEETPEEPAEETTQDPQEAEAATADASAGSPAEAPTEDAPQENVPAPAEEQPTGEIPPLAPPATGGADEDDRPTGAIPAVGDEEPTREDDTDTRETPRGPNTGELPIAPDEDADRRAREKRFFPPQSADSALSADPARSAASAEESDGSSRPEQRASAEPGEEPEEEPDGAAPRASEEQDDQSSSAPANRLTETSGSVYSAFPGLRPPTS